MAGFIPKFRLYDTTGTVLIYTFTAVDFTNAPQSVEKFVTTTNIRAKGSLTAEGGESEWDLQLRFALIGDDYIEVTSLIEDLETTVEFNTPYILRLDKTTGSFFEWKVKRLQPFTYPENLRNNFQRVNATFLVNSW